MKPIRLVIQFARDLAPYILAATVAMAFTHTIGPALSCLILQFILAMWLVGRWERRKQARILAAQANKRCNTLNVAPHHWSEAIEGLPIAAQETVRRVMRRGAWPN